MSKILTPPIISTVWHWLRPLCMAAVTSFFYPAVNGSEYSNCPAGWMFVDSIVYQPGKDYLLQLPSNCVRPALCLNHHLFPYSTNIGEMIENLFFFNFPCESLFGFIVQNFRRWFENIETLLQTWYLYKFIHRISGQKFCTVKVHNLRHCSLKTYSINNSVDTLNINNWAVLVRNETNSKISIIFGQKKINE